MIGAAVAVALPGCGGPSDVSGRVTHQGKTVVSGTVTLVGSDGVAVSGGIGPDGRYVVSGVRSGDVQIAVTSPKPRPSVAAKALYGDPSARGATVTTEKKPKGATAPEKPKEPDPPPGWFPLPEKYADPQKSGLTASVSGGRSSLDIELP